MPDARANIRTLYSAEQIRERVNALAQQITRDYADRALVLVCILKGSFVFAADLARAIDLPLQHRVLGRAELRRRHQIERRRSDHAGSDAADRRAKTC